MSRLVRFGTGLAFAAALLGCAPSGPALRVGVNDWPPCELWYIAQREGYFGRMRVELVRFTSWFDNMSALYRGNLDVTHASYFNAVYLSDKGERGKIILASDTVAGGDGLAVRAGIATGAQLAGMRVAVEANTDEHFLLREALKDFGLGEEDIEIVPTTSAEAGDLLAEGEADACFTYEPSLTAGATGSGGKVLWTTRDKPGYMVWMSWWRRRAPSRIAPRTSACSRSWATTKA